MVFDKDYIIETAKSDETEHNGEIIAVGDKSLRYFNYDADYINFRYPETIDKEYVKSLLFVGKQVEDCGFNKDVLAGFLCDIFKDELGAAFCSARKICLFMDEAEFEEAVKSIGLDEEYDPFEFSFEDVDGMLGREWFAKQVCFVNIGECVKSAEDSYDGLYPRSKELAICVYTTLAHETRHLMVDDIFLPEELYPEDAASEEAVEEFCRESYEGVEQKYDGFPVRFPSLEAGCVTEV